MLTVIRIRPVITDSLLSRRAGVDVMNMKLISNTIMMTMMTMMNIIIRMMVQPLVRIMMMMMIITAIMMISIINIGFVIVMTTQTMLAMMSTRHATLNEYDTWRW